MASDRRHGSAWLVAAPPLALSLACLALTGLGMAGANPFWTPSDLTMSEAAALRDPATVLVLMEQGQDPYAAYPVRAGLIDRAGLHLTPVEAAVREDRLEVAAVILGHPAWRSAERVCHWLQLAGAEGAGEISRYIRRTFPEDADTCR